MKRSVNVIMVVAAMSGVTAFAAEPNPVPQDMKPSAAVLEGRFGRAEINTEYPGLTALTLRSADGQLDSQSILATASRKAAWAVGAYTYADVEEGRRMESRNSKPESVEVKPDHVAFRGIKLNVPDGFAPLASEDWYLSVEGDELVWKVTRTWLVTTRIQRSGMYRHAERQGCPEPALDRPQPSRLVRHREARAGG